MEQPQFDSYRERVEKALDLRLPAPSIQPTALHDAMRYSLLAGGKRIRPILVYSAGVAVGAPLSHLDAPACAVECIHAYSLIHDDLPAMDDDDLRRGRPTCHKAFDEATAILAGDALQALAFRILSQDAAGVENPDLRLQMIDRLATAAGSRGMAGGQAMDLDAVGKSLDVAELECMHVHKTGALIRASVMLGALSEPGVNAAVLEHLDDYAKCIGLAFQIQDDILDVVGDTETLGKRQGADRALNKPTYVSLLGLEEARLRARSLHESALGHLDGLGAEAEPLRWLSGYIVQRSH